MDINITTQGNNWNFYKLIINHFAINSTNSILVKINYVNIHNEMKIAMVGGQLGLTLSEKVL